MIQTLCWCVVGEEAHLLEQRQPLDYQVIIAVESMELNQRDVSILLKRIYFNDSNIITVEVLFFAGTYFRSQLSPKQFAGIQICATSTGCDIYYKYFNSRVLIFAVIT